MSGYQPTPFEQSSADFSQAAHVTARKVVYEQWFRSALMQGGRLDYESTTIADGARGAVLDGDMATDRIVKVRSRLFTQHDFNAEHLEHAARWLQFTVQERFRKPEFQHYQDITLTTWNTWSNSPSELFKLQAQWFVYGYFNQENNYFLEAVVINIGEMMAGLANHKLKFRDGKNQKGQTFITVKFTDLWALDMIHVHIENNQPRFVRFDYRFDQRFQP